MKKSLFSIDGFDAIFEGYTDGTHWNGWAKPYFTKEVGMDIVRCNNMANDLAYHMSYNEKTDSFIRLDDEFEPEVFQGIDTNGLHLYPIGNACWVWDDIADYQSDQTKKLMAYLRKEYDWLNCEQLYDVYYSIAQDIDYDMDSHEVEVFADNFILEYRSKMND